MMYLYSLQTVSRASSRKSRPASSGSHLTKHHASDSDSDDDMPKRKDITISDVDFSTVDILDEKAFDTDLEIEGRKFFTEIQTSVIG